MKRLEKIRAAMRSWAGADASPDARAAQVDEAEPAFSQAEALVLPPTAGAGAAAERTDVRGLVRFASGAVVMLALCAALLLEGCAATSADAENSAASAMTTAASASSSTDYASFEDVAADFDESALDLDYSKRDMDASYDASTATTITLAGDSPTVSGAGATASADGVTITAAGTYVVTGELTDGQLLVAAGDEDKVQIVLAGATIHNEDGPAIYVQNADKCFVTLADGTENTLTDGESYAFEADSDEPYATLFARCDLTLNGSGTLNVTAAYRHAVCSKDDLVVVSGTYNISAVEDGLRGRDSVKIRDGVFTIEAGGDGIKSNKDSKPTKGFVSIDGGTFSIQAGDGIDSNGNVEVAGGVVLVAGPTSDGDGAFDYDLSATISGGTVLMVGSAGMAQNFTSGTQAFAMIAARGTAGQTVAVVDGNGNVVASFTATKQFGMVLASSPAFAEGGEYTLVIGGTVAGANADGYATSGTVSDGNEISITASCTATSGLGGLGQAGSPMGTGQSGDVQVQRW